MASMQRCCLHADRAADPAGLIIRFRELGSFRPENATSGMVQVSCIRDHALDFLQDGAVELAGW
jgi:hypothetical protein